MTGVDLLDRLLSFDHRIRPTAEEALGKISEDTDPFIACKSILYFSSSIFRTFA